jgi:DNA primase
MASKEFIVKLKETLDITEVVGESVQLRRSGKYLTGLSPFTKEKTPSFFVNPENQSFYCYSSNQGGDIITFVELTKGLTFRESLEYLAKKAGLELDDTHKTPEQIARDRQREEERKLLLKLNRFAARFYQEQLEGPAGAIGRDYIAKRGIQPDSVLAFALGYAPDSWTALRDYFLKIQAPLLKAHDLGLFRTKGGEKPKADGSNLFDTFRNRLIFPIRDPQGEVLGFGGRWLGAASAEAPKYLNSSESPVYEKEKVLYNLDQARRSIRELETVVLVEGYMDCLSMVQAGFPNVVANCGTALTRPQAGLLRKLAPKVICLYDSDSAGQAATERAMNLFLETEGFPLLGASLPDGKDPDDFLRAHGEKGRLRLAEILQASSALVDLWIDRTIAECPKALQARAEAVDKIAAKLAKLRDELWIRARIPGVAKGLDVDVGLVLEAIRKYRKGFAMTTQVGTTARTRPEAPRQAWPKKRASSEKSTQNQAQNAKRDFGFERRFLSDLLKRPNWIAALRERQVRDQVSVLSLVENPAVRSVFAKILEPLRSGESDEDRIRELQESFRDQAELRNIIAEAMMKWDEPLLEKELDGAMARLREESLRNRAADLQRKIDEAERGGDSGATEVLLQELIELRRQRLQK